MSNEFIVYFPTNKTFIIGSFFAKDELLKAIAML